MEKRNIEPGSVTIPNRLHCNYRWIICAGCLLLHACACGLTASAFSSYSPYLMETIGLTNTQTSLIITIRCLSSMLVMLTCTRYYQIFSLRAGVSVSCLILVVSCFMFAWANSAAMCYLAAVIMGAAYSYGTMVPISLFMRNWFHDHRSTALAIAACGSGVTTTVAPPLITALAESHGLRYTFLAEAAVVTLCSAILFLILRDKPADLGLHPYETVRKNREEKPLVSKAKDVILTRGEHLLFLFAAFLVGCLGAPYLAHLTLHYRNTGYTGVQTAGALSIVGIAMVMGKFFFGMASDRWGTYRVNYLFLGSWVVGCLATAMVDGNSIPLLYVTTVLNGFGVSLGTIGITVWAGDFSSAATYEKSIADTQFAFSLGALSWATVPGAIADVTGSFRLAYLISTGMICVTLMIVQHIYRCHRMAM